MHFVVLAREKAMWNIDKIFIIFAYIQHIRKFTLLK